MTYGSFFGDHANALLPLIGAIAGIIVSSLMSLVAAVIIGSREQRAKFKQLAIEAGLDNWRHQNALKIDIKKANPGAVVDIGPPDPFILHMLTVMSIATNPKLSPEEIERQVIDYHKRRQTQTE